MLLAAFAVDLRRGDSKPVGVLRLRCRPGRAADRGIPLLIDQSAEESLVANGILALLEDSEYLYEVHLNSPISHVKLEPSELFDADETTGLIGRLRTREYTGGLMVSVFEGARLVGSCELEVRSRKLGYLTDYRAMLSSIAQEGAELLLMRFAPTMLSALIPDTETDARTLYQQFAFLRSLLEDPSFEAAVAIILNHPHEQFEREQEIKPAGRGFPTGSGLIRQFAGPGPRVPAPMAVGLISHIPRTLIIDQFSGTLDTEPNRFVRMVFEHWRTTCVLIRDAIRLASASAPIARGLREVTYVIDEIDRVLASPVLREAGVLGQFPAADQVLQKRAGYRDVMRAFLQSQVAGHLRWDGGEDVFSAGQRDVATLYEFWCYLQLARIVESLCNQDFDRSELFELSEDRLVLKLRGGHRQVLRGEVVRHDRRLGVELWFNRSFRRESWSCDMRPDLSLRITVEPANLASDSIWLHFDAKYRIERGTDVMSAEDDEGSQERGAISARRSDLLKMHSYRDAIRHSAGAYVLYPGTDSEGNIRTEYDEIVPGIGAFPFRVGLDGNADSASALQVRVFLDGVITHAANQASNYERQRYWTERSYERVAPAVRARTFLLHPPADTIVLLGYVRDAKHLEWISKNRLYNLRGDDRTGSVGRDASLLSAEIIALYGPTLREALLFRREGPAELFTKEAMTQLGYPSPRGLVYCCLRLVSLDLGDHPISVERVRDACERAMPHAATGYPVVTTWADLGT